MGMSPEVPADVSEVFNPKWNAEGKVDRYKAQLEAKGCRQREGIEEVVAPVSKYSTVRAAVLTGPLRLPLPALL